MAEFTKTNLGIVHRFDTRTKRHYMNGTQTVYHCHHYATLYTQLAIDAGEEELMAQSSEDSFYPILCRMLEENGAIELEDRVELARQYYAAIGLGALEVEFLGDDAAQIVSTHSHLEQGWLKKWGVYDKPVNYIGCGYVSAMLAAVLGQNCRSFATFETTSIAMGASQTTFKSYKK